MLRATGSTGLKKGPASFIFLSVRTVDVENRHCARLRLITDDVLGADVCAGAGAGVVAGRGVVLSSGETDAGGGVPVFRQRHQHARSGAQ